MILRLMQYGFNSADAGPASRGIIYQQLLHQSEFLSFTDCFRVIGLALPRNDSPPRSNPEIQRRRSNKDLR
jgi:hypothetical protein